MRRTLPSRFLALLVLLSVGLAAPVAALAHGAAHHREHDERSHHGVAVADHADGPGVSDAHDERDHQHPRIDGALRGRVDGFSFILVAAPLARVVEEVLVFGAASPTWHTGPARATFATGPPPRLRSPPLI